LTTSEKKIPGKSTAVHRDEGTASARRVRVDRPGDQFLAGAALTGQQDRGLALLQVLDEPEDPKHRGRASDQSGESLHENNRMFRNRNAAFQAGVLRSELYFGEGGSSSRATG
jgi:hypothetical protein